MDEEFTAAFVADLADELEGFSGALVSDRNVHGEGFTGLDESIPVAVDLLEEGREGKVRAWESLDGKEDLLFLLQFVGSEDGDFERVDLGIDPFGKLDLCGPTACLFGGDLSEDKFASVEEPKGRLGDCADAIGRGCAVVSDGDLDLVCTACEDAALLDLGVGFVFVVFAVAGEQLVRHRERGWGCGGRFPRDTDLFERGVDLLFFGLFGFLKDRKRGVVHLDSFGCATFREEGVSEFDLKVHVQLFVFFVVIGNRSSLFFFVVEIAEAEHGGALFANPFEISGKLFAVDFAWFFFEKLDLIFVDVNGTERDVGCDADILDRDISGGKVLGDSEFERGAFGAKARDDGIKDLNRSFAIGALSEDKGAVVVFECARDDLGGRSGAVVDENNDRIIGLGIDVGCVSFARRRRTACVCDDHAFGEKGIGNTDGLVKESTWIVAQVENQAAQLFDFEGHTFECCEHFAGGVLLKVFDLDVGDVVFE